MANHRTFRLNVKYGRLTNFTLNQEYFSVDLYVGALFKGFLDGIIVI